MKDYSNLPISELEQKRHIASEWLLENPHHKNYTTALQRYLAIVAELHTRRLQRKTLSPKASEVLSVLG